jgi:pimeloyl-ACP methyl ester carboxylesterase
LDGFVPDLQLTRLPGATHWVVHEQPQRVMAWLAGALRQN